MYVSISRRGSTVAVNIPSSGRYDRHPAYNPHELVPKVPHTPLPSGTSPTTEDVQFRLAGPGTTVPVFQQGVLLLEEIDLDSVRVLNSCMAQTVNLQFFESQVEGMHGTVQQIHASIESGALTSNSLWRQAAEAIGTTFGRRNELATGELYRHLANVNAISNQIVLSGLRNT